MRSEVHCTKYKSTPCPRPPSKNYIETCMSKLTQQLCTHCFHQGILLTVFGAFKKCMVLWRLLSGIRLS